MCPANRVFLKMKWDTYFAHCLAHGKLSENACSCLRQKRPMLAQILWEADAEMRLYMQICPDETSEKDEGEEKGVAGKASRQ